MVIVRLDTQNRMVTKDYQTGVYEWVEEGFGIGKMSRQIESSSRFENGIIGAQGASGLQIFQ